MSSFLAKARKSIDTLLGNTTAITENIDTLCTEGQRLGLLDETLLYDTIELIKSADTIPAHPGSTEAIQALKPFLLETFNKSSNAFSLLNAFFISCGQPFQTYLVVKSDTLTLIGKHLDKQQHYSGKIIAAFHDNLKDWIAETDVAAGKDAVANSVNEALEAFVVRYHHVFFAEGVNADAIAVKTEEDAALNSNSLNNNSGNYPNQQQQSAQPSSSGVLDNLMNAFGFGSDNNNTNANTNTNASNGNTMASSAANTTPGNSLSAILDFIEISRNEVAMFVETINFFDTSRGISIQDDELVQEFWRKMLSIESRVNGYLQTAQDEALVNGLLELNTSVNTAKEAYSNMVVATSINQVKQDPKIVTLAQAPRKTSMTPSLEERLARIIAPSSPVSGADGNGGKQQLERMSEGSRHQDENGDENDYTDLKGNEEDTGKEIDTTLDKTTDEIIETEEEKAKRLEKRLGKMKSTE